MNETGRLDLGACLEVVSAKPGVKLSIDDIVTHGFRNKKVRGMIILIGEYHALSVG